jgi:sigma-B regulation protein RsbU (phosphoserine phosphatase)
MLGAYADERYEPVTVPIEPGDILLLYSDGVLDAVGAEDRFEAERLQAALAGTTTAKDAVERVQHALADFQFGAQHDDIAVLAVEPVRAHRRPDDARHPQLQRADRDA